MTAPDWGGLFSKGDFPMIAAIRNQESRTEGPASNAAFLAMLPAIRRTAQITFRKVRPELVPAGMVSSTAPSSVGTRTLAPSTAS